MERWKGNGERKVREIVERWKGKGMRNVGKV